MHNKIGILEVKGYTHLKKKNFNFNVKLSDYFRWFIARHI